MAWFELPFDALWPELLFPEFWPELLLSQLVPELPFEAAWDELPLDEFWAELSFEEDWDELLLDGFWAELLLDEFCAELPAELPLDCAKAAGKAKLVISIAADADNNTLLILIDLRTSAALAMHRSCRKEVGRDKL